MEIYCSSTLFAYWIPFCQDIKVRVDFLRSYYASYSQISKIFFLSDTQCEQDFLEVRFAQLGEGVVSPMARNEQTPEKIACCFNIVTNIHSIIVNCQEFLAVNVLHISFLAKLESWIVWFTENILQHYKCVCNVNLIHTMIRKRSSKWTPDLYLMHGFVGKISIT